MVNSPLTSSFIYSSVFVTITFEGSRFPCISNISYPSRNMVPTDVPKFLFVLHTSGALGGLPVVQTERNCHLFIG